MTNFIRKLYVLFVPKTMEEVIALSSVQSRNFVVEVAVNDKIVWYMKSSDDEQLFVGKGSSATRFTKKMAEATAEELSNDYKDLEGFKGAKAVWLG